MEEREGQPLYLDGEWGCFVEAPDIYDPKNSLECIKLIREFNRRLHEP